MAQQVIVPIMPNLGSQAEAMAGAQAVTFTATERQIIKERGLKPITNPKTAPKMANAPERKFISKAFVLDIPEYRSTPKSASSCGIS